MSLVVVRRARAAPAHGPPPKPKFGAAQLGWIKHVQDEVTAKGAAFFRGKDWSCIAPPGGRNAYLNQHELTQEDYYKRPIAVWAPQFNLVQNCQTTY